MPSIHDSLLVGYEVDGRDGRIVLHTVPHQGGGEVAIDVIFLGVVAYRFDNDAMLNIVLAIEEIEGTAIDDGQSIAARASQFSELEKSTRFYWLSSSYGMDGWIAAREMRQIVRD